MLELASSLFKDSPVLELKFLQLVAEKNIIYKAHKKKDAPVGDESLIKNPRIFMLSSNLESDNCDLGLHDVTTSVDMCYAVFSHEDASLTVEHFLNKLKLHMGSEFLTFARLVSKAKSAFSEHMYMDLITHVGQIKRILPGQFRREFEVFFPICKAYQVYPHLLFRDAISKQRALLHTERAQSPRSAHQEMKEELLNQQRTSNSKLRERLNALQSISERTGSTSMTAGLQLERSISDPFPNHAKKDVRSQTHLMQKQTPPTQQKLTPLKQQLQAQQQVL